MMSFSATKDGGRTRKERTFRVRAYISQVTFMCHGALLSWRWLNTSLPIGSSEWIPYFALHQHTAFTLPIKLSLSQPTSFLTFSLPFLSPIPL